MIGAFPETFKEICESVLEEANGRPVEIPTTDLGKDGSGNWKLTDPTQRNVVRWVQQEYMKFQKYFPDWTFLFKRGLVLTTQVGVEEYRRSQFEQIDVNSLFTVNAAGTSGRIPVFVRDYAEWQHRKRVGETSGGNPLVLYESPKHTWLVWPTPTTSWNVYGDVWKDGCVLEGDGDMPRWDTKYNMLLVWGALRMFAAEFGGEGVGPILTKRIELQQGLLYDAFMRRYVPSLGGAPALV